MLSASEVFKGSDSENSCPTSWSSSGCSGQLSDLKLILLAPLRQFNASDRHCGNVESLESEHWADPLVNSTMVLFDELVQVFAGVGDAERPHRFLFTDCSV